MRLTISRTRVVRTRLALLSTAGAMLMALPVSLAQLNPLTVNEFMTSNGKTRMDEDRDYPDWVEIYNEGSTAVNLSGWILTDTVGGLGGWPFPSTNLAAGGYLVVFASGKNRAVSGRELHTDFNLDAEGEYLGLISPEGDVVSEYAPVFPPQFVDVSYGRKLGRELYFPVPTPGSANGTGYNSFVADTKFSHDRGFYSEAFDLTIGTATADATILYTTNGTVPSIAGVTTNGNVYAGSIPIRGTTILRAAAFKAGSQPSNVDTQTYLFLDDVVRQSPDGKAPSGWPASWGANVVNYGMDPDIVNHAEYGPMLEGGLLSLPSFSVVMPLNALFNVSTGIYANAQQDTRSWERACSLELIHPDGRDGFQVDCGIRIRGGYSRSSSNPKHAFRLFFREVYGASKLEYALFGEAGAATFDCLDLRTFQNYSWSFEGDTRGVFLRDQFSRDTQLDMGHAAERGDFCHLYINGQYWGLYNTCERPEASFGESYLGGQAGDYDVIKVSPDNGYTIGATDGNLLAWTRLYNACKGVLTNDAAYERILGNNPDGTRNASYERLVELDNLMDYMLVILHGGNLDAPISNFLGNNSPNNFYGMRNRTGADGFRFMAHDSEHTLLSVTENRIGPYAAGNSAVSSSSPQWVWQRLWTNAEFRVTMGDRVHRHYFNGGLLTPAACAARFQRRAQEMERAVVAESARWGDSKRATPLTLADWRRERDSILNSYIPQRSAIVLGQLRSKGLYPTTVAPTFSPHGGVVDPGFELTMSAPAGILYFTVDGTDPRLRGGAVAPSARRYTTPVGIAESGLVRSRVLNGTNWSALNEASFTVIQTYTNLVISEIMYHPAPEGEIDGDEFEFLELKNLNPFVVDLSGVRFTNGIQFVFPNGSRLGAGQFLVLVDNPALFAQRYPGVTPAGVYEGNLANGGERLELVHAAGASLFALTYDDRPPWPVTADGTGFSLVPRSAQAGANPDAPGYWRASHAVGGSPGAEDPPADEPGVVIHEVLTHTDPPALDAIELYHPGPGDADISGWFLTDDLHEPRKFRVPAGTLIPAGGYRVFDEGDFNADPGVPACFTLDSHGEEVFLFAADEAGDLTGYGDGFSFGAAANGVSFGRWTNSVGVVSHPPQRLNTLGRANAGPAVGPVVIHEIYPWPAAGEIEFVELRNLLNVSVALYDVGAPTNTWRLNGIGYDFPAGVVLPPRGLLVVAGAAPDVFRALHPVPESVPVFGPFPGTLQDGGELLELQRPDTPEVDTHGVVQVPYLTVDAVDYDVRAPWPTNASQRGVALERIRAAGFGNDAGNWSGASGPSTPGSLSEGNRAPWVDAGADAQIESQVFPASLVLSGTAGDDGLPEYPGRLSLAWSAVSAPGPVVFDDIDSATTTVRFAGTGDYILRLTATDGLLTVRNETAVTVKRPAARQVLVASGSSWRYLDNGVDPKTAWRASGFDDSGWAVGPAQFGYSGESPEHDEATTLRYGSSTQAKHPAYYFRRAFEVSDAAAVTRVTARLLRDDGAVVYLNGSEAFRDNMPLSTIAHTTLASEAVSGADESTFFEHDVDPARLVTGANVLAIEIHQNSASSTDVSFDFAFEIDAYPVNQPPEALAGADVNTVAGRWTRLEGMFHDDGLPSPPGAPSVTWTVTSGPGTVVFSRSDAWVTYVAFGQSGMYRLQLGVNDGAALATDEVVVTAAPPELSAPVLQPVALDVGASASITLRWQAEGAVNYVVEFQDALTADTWQVLSVIPPLSAPREVEVVDPVDPGGLSRYYRVRVESASGR